MGLPDHFIDTFVCFVDQALHLRDVGRCEDEWILFENGLAKVLQKLPVPIVRTGNVVHDHGGTVGPDKCFEIDLSGADHPCKCGNNEEPSLLENVFDEIDRVRRRAELPPVNMGRTRSSTIASNLRLLTFVTPAYHPSLRQRIASLRRKTVEMRPQLRYPELSSIPTVIVTVQPLRQPDRYSLRITDVIHKPFEDEAILQAVERACQTRQPIGATLQPHVKVWLGHAAARWPAPTMRPTRLLSVGKKRAGLLCLQMRAWDGFATDARLSGDGRPINRSRP